MSVNKIFFGKSGNQDIYKYEVVCGEIKASFCELGASIMSIILKDKDGIDRDVVLGIDKIEDYEHNWPAFGAVIGRCANRISKAGFTLNGKKYKLDKNIKGGCIHSGFSYHYRRWQSEAYEDSDSVHVIFKLLSEDGDQGYPGRLTVQAEYILSKDHSITIWYRYCSDKDTIVNLTNHSYFNLLGHDGGEIFDHSLYINSGSVTQFDKNLMPTGEILNVSGSAFDFTSLRTIRENLDKPFTPYCHMNEYDINYVLSEHFGEYRHVATLASDKTGIGLKVYTDMPGMQLYTANGIGGIQGKNGVKYVKHSGICFETQFYPDAINIDRFQSPIVKAGENKSSRTKLEFYRI